MKLVIDDCKLEIMDVYTDPLNDKIKRHAAEITRLLADNAELKKGREAIRDNAFEAGLIRGQEEAWELAQKIFNNEDLGGYSIHELNEIFNTSVIREIINLTYSEAAAKVAEWERKNEEICVGDIVSVRNANICGVVTYKDTTDNTMDVMTPTEGTIFVEKVGCKKTGKHIDVDAWLAQICGESE